jgi:hypothetical protein
MSVDQTILTLDEKLNILQDIQFDKGDDGLSDWLVDKVTGKYLRCKTEFKEFYDLLFDIEVEMEEGKFDVDTLRCVWETFWKLSYKFNKLYLEYLDSGFIRFDHLKSSRLKFEHIGKNIKSFVDIENKIKRWDNYPSINPQNPKKFVKNRTLLLNDNLLTIINSFDEVVELCKSTFIDWTNINLLSW